MMDKLKNLWKEIVYQLEDFGHWLTWKFPYKKRARIRKALREILIYVTVVLLVVLIFKSYQPVETQKYEITYNITEAQATEQTVEPNEPKTELGKAIKEMIKTECARQRVDINMVYAIINSDDPDDGLPRYGIMKLHPDLIKKYDANYRDGVGVVESIYSNMESGVRRLKWALDNNQTLEGALMVYVYTKPIAQKMWADGIKTTDWVEEVKGVM